MNFRWKKNMVRKQPFSVWSSMHPPHFWWQGLQANIPNHSDSG